MAGSFYRTTNNASVTYIIANKTFQWCSLPGSFSYTHLRSSFPFHSCDVFQNTYSLFPCVWTFQILTTNTINHSFLPAPPSSNSGSTLASTLKHTTSFFQHRIHVRRRESVTDVLPDSTTSPTTASNGTSSGGSSNNNNNTESGSHKTVAHLRTQPYPQRNSPGKSCFHNYNKRKLRNSFAEPNFESAHSRMRTLKVSLAPYEHHYKLVTQLVCVWILVRR